LNVVSQFINCSDELADLAGFADKPCVAVLGSYNVGKSTLLNRLLGESISPVDIIPTTSCILNFSYGNTFKAKYRGPGVKKDFSRREDLHSFLAQKKSPAGKVDIQLPSPLLKKCRLMDTPGIDFLSAGAEQEVLQSAGSADKVIYLFHQKGIEERNREFLYRLADIWKGKSLNNISFWLNCNLGGCDGTSLETTGAALREIFTGRVKLNTINTLKPEDIEVLRCCLEVELAGEVFKRTDKVIKKMDGELPARLKAAAGIKDDGRFLEEFWGILDIAGKILNAGRVLYTLPSVLKEIERSLALMNRNNLGRTPGKPSGRPYRTGFAGIKEIRASLLELVRGIREKRRIQDFVDLRVVENLYREIENKRFTVAVAGGFSTGKSTFLNAVLRDDVLPTADRPSTLSPFFITHGCRKTAAVRKSLQVVLDFYDIVGGKAVLNREEVTTLENWLVGPDSGIACIEKWTGSRFERSDRRDMLKQLENIKKLFAAGFFPGSTQESKAWAFKPVPVKRTRKSPPKARVTFKNRAEPVFDLSNSLETEEFKKAVSPENTLKTDCVRIEHPCELLKTFNFIDTPGLDWIKRRRYEQIAACIRQSDACLVFFNARHILHDMNKPDSRNPPGTGGEEGGRQLEGLIDDFDKFYFAVNFADAVSPHQREAVCNFVRNRLNRPAKSGEIIPENPKIFLISSLNEITGENGGIRALLKNLEEGILKSRGRQFFQSKAGELQTVLDRATRKANEKMLSGRLSCEDKRGLEEAIAVLRESRRRLKEIRTAIYFSGRYRE